MKKNMMITKIEKAVLMSLFLVMISCSTSRTISRIPDVIPGIHITFTGDQVADSVYVTVAPIPTDTSMYLLKYLEEIENGRTDVYAVKDRSVHIKPDSVPSSYKIRCDNYLFSPYYMRNSDHLDMEISGLSQKKYKLTGGIYSSEIPYSKEFFTLKGKLYKISRYKLTEQEFDSLSREMNLLIDKIMKESDPETATRVVSQLEDDFAPYAFERLPEGSQNTLYYTLASILSNTGIRSANQENMIDSALETSAPVPEVTLNSLDGQTFNVSSLRGKWVILDFWVSWCGPCRRGFEKMKKLYADHSDRLEIVGIACGDQNETWSRLVEELELPWTNLLAPSPSAYDGTVAGFPVPAYPTKVIIDPEGRLRDFTVGEDEGFYGKFETMINEGNKKN